jgi:hypothetical protein
MREAAGKRTMPNPPAATLLVRFVMHQQSNHGKVSLRRLEKLRPPNHGYRRGVAKLLQRYADKPSGEAKQQLAEILPEEVLRTLTTERARELAEATRGKERRLNNAFVERLVARMRGLVREARRRGMNVLMLVDPIDPDSLRGTRLQGTLLRARRAWGTWQCTRARCSGS